jgi:hypothetical protein
VSGSQRVDYDEPRDIGAANRDRDCGLRTLDQELMTRAIGAMAGEPPPERQGFPVAFTVTRPRFPLKLHESSGEALGVCLTVRRAE